MPPPWARLAATARSVRTATSGVDATCHKVRVDGRVISQATVVEVGLTTNGDRQVLGIDVGPSEDRAFWTAFLRGMVKRGLRGVRLVVSEAREERSRPSGPC